MKKKQCLVVSLFLLIFGFANIFAQNPTYSFDKKWKSTKWNYEITIPRYWRVVDTNDPRVASPECDLFIESGMDGSTAVFVYSGLHKSFTIEKLFDDIFNRLHKKSFKKIGDITKWKINRENMEILVVEFDAFSGEWGTLIYSIVFTDTIDLIISSGCPKRVFPSHKEAFLNIVNSVNVY